MDPPTSGGGRTGKKFGRPPCILFLFSRTPPHTFPTCIYIGKTTYLPQENSTPPVIFLPPPQSAPPEGFKWNSPESQCSKCWKWIESVNVFQLTPWNMKSVSFLKKINKMLPAWNVSFLNRVFIEEKNDLKGAVNIYGWVVGGWNPKILSTQNLPPLDNRAL